MKAKSIFRAQGKASQCEGEILRSRVACGPRKGMHVNCASPPSDRRLTRIRVGPFPRIAIATRGAEAHPLANSPSVNRHLQCVLPFDASPFSLRVSALTLCVFLHCFSNLPALYPCSRGSRARTQNHPTQSRRRKKGRKAEGSHGSHARLLQGRAQSAPVSS